MKETYSSESFKSCSVLICPEQALNTTLSTQ